MESKQPVESKQTVDEMTPDEINEYSEALAKEYVKQYYQDQNQDPNNDLISHIAKIANTIARNLQTFEMFIMVMEYDSVKGKRELTFGLASKKLKIQNVKKALYALKTDEKPLLDCINEYFIVTISPSHKMAEMLNKYQGYIKNKTSNNFIKFVQDHIGEPLCVETQHKIAYNILLSKCDLCNNIFSLKWIEYEVIKSGINFFNMVVQDIGPKKSKFVITLEELLQIEEQFILDNNAPPELLQKEDMKRYLSILKQTDYSGERFVREFQPNKNLPNKQEESKLSDYFVQNNNNSQQTNSKLQAGQQEQSQNFLNSQPFTDTDIVLKIIDPTELLKQKLQRIVNTYYQKEEEEKGKGK